MNMKNAVLNSRTALTAQNTATALQKHKGISAGAVNFLKMKNASAHAQMAPPMATALTQKKDMPAGTDN